MNQIGGQWVWLLILWSSVVNEVLAMDRASLTEDFHDGFNFIAIAGLDGEMCIRDSSQGGAMALFTGTRATEKLAGIIGLSCYMVLGSTLAAEHSAVNQTTPIFVAHGTRDPVVDEMCIRDSTRT